MAIAPGDVRSIPGPDDPYEWQALPKTQHLFEKHISKHSIGAYRELCREVGKSFLARKREASQIRCKSHTDGQVRGMIAAIQYTHFD